MEVAWVAQGCSQDFKNYIRTKLYPHSKSQKNTIRTFPNYIRTQQFLQAFGAKKHPHIFFAPSARKTPQKNRDFGARITQLYSYYYSIFDVKGTSRLSSAC